jgi:hypothetical protein
MEGRALRQKRMSKSYEPLLPRVCHSDARQVFTAQFAVIY